MTRAGDVSERESLEEPRVRRGDGLLTTGDMARLTGNTLRTVRFYEEAKILEPDRRSAGGHRLFSLGQLERLQFITDMRATGLSLDEIKALLELKGAADSGKQAADGAIDAIDAQIEALDQKLAVFNRLRAELCRAREVLEQCRTCTNQKCFPDACHACDVILRESELPASLRVLWMLGRE